MTNFFKHEEYIIALLSRTDEDIRKYKEAILGNYKTTQQNYMAIKLSLMTCVYLCKVDSMLRMAISDLRLSAVDTLIETEGQPVFDKLKIIERLLQIQQEVSIVALKQLMALKEQEKQQEKPEL